MNKAELEEQICFVLFPRACLVRNLGNAVSNRVISAGIFEAYLLWSLAGFCVEGQGFDQHAEIIKLLLLGGGPCFSLCLVRLVASSRLLALQIFTVGLIVRAFSRLRRVSSFFVIILSHFSVGVSATPSESESVSVTGELTRGGCLLSNGGLVTAVE
jgi:hypothetical protein